MSEKDNENKMEKVAHGEPCSVVQGQSKDGKVHVVGISALKVVIVKDGENAWFAQGLDIDYAAEGTSVENVKDNFENGLTATLHQHLLVYSNLNKLLKPAPPEIWQEMFYSHVIGVFVVNIHLHSLLQGSTAGRNHKVKSATPNARL